MSNEQRSVFRRDSESGSNAMLELLAPLYIGLIINYLLWGVQIAQSYYYYKSYRKTDRTWVKAAVGVLFVTDVIESICLSQACWIFLVEGWGDLNKITFFPGWGFYATPVTDAFTASIVHFFYAQKIWTLLEVPLNYIFTAVVIALSLTQLIGGLGGSIFIYTIQMSLPEFFRFKTWASIWLFTAALTDIVITSVMTWRLSHSRTGFKKTDDIISKLIRLTVETGLATAFVQILDIIIFLVWPLKSYHVCLAFIGPKVYSNSMLALLNSRQTKDTPLTWGTTTSHQEMPVESIVIKTTQTVTVNNSYELKENFKDRNNASRSPYEERAAPDAGSVSSLPFSSKDRGAGDA